MTCDGEAAGNGDGERRVRRRRGGRGVGVDGDGDGDGETEVEDADDGATARGGGGRLEGGEGLKGDPGRPRFAGWDGMFSKKMCGMGVGSLKLR